MDLLVTVAEQQRTNEADIELLLQNESDLTFLSQTQLSDDFTPSISCAQFKAGSGEKAITSSEQMNHSPALENLSCKMLPVDLARAGMRAETKVPKEIRLHRKACHRCGNMRKNMGTCSELRCPHVFCISCHRKLIQCYGPGAFINGCPVCKNFCCCADKSRMCEKAHHCYRKCPVSRDKHRARMKKDVLVDAASNYAH